MIVEVAVSLFLIWTIWYISNTCIKKQGMPSGSFPFPWIGNVPHVTSDQAFPFRKLSKEYGEIFTVFMPNGTFVVLNTASLARNARLGTKDDVAGRSSELTNYPLELILGKDVVFSDYSAGYLFRKRVFKSSLHVFGSGLGQAEDRARHAVQLALQEIEKCQSFSPNELVPSTIFAQVWEWLTSKKITLDDPTISLFKEIQGIIMNQSRERSIYLLIPFLGYITNYNRKIEKAKDIKKRLLPHEFSAHRETYTPGVIRDLTDSFIGAYEKEIANWTGKAIGSIEDVPDLMLDVVLTAIDTVSTTICWFILYNVLHQDIQAKLHKELDDVVENDRLPCWKDAQNMPYLQATLCEVLRRSDIVPLTATTVIRDTTIGGYHIPKNTNIVININEIHHDPKELPEPNEFKPERFLDNDGKFVGWTTKHAFMPFGLGRRECLGQLFARIVMFTFASTLLHLYKIELPEGAEKPTTSPIGLQIHHPKDFTVVAKKRH
ncbi:steroid 17-alpha-hydroxylase 17,20 lyase-like [Paramuricea clavata]|uniref:Steroid 17-alpha-hydroxylase 17,20 lyase-like n=1 Tax=Paramuricea clavata TaxID=317549 RepID=A0A6S7GKG7_PARCT|nr:steroid 17-alpha-hydroxylase 17,20 lyase-like [Paramuricea clavata]